MQSISNSRYISIENDGYSALKAAKCAVESEAQLFEFIHAQNHLKNKFLLKSCSNGKYVSIDHETKKLTAIETNPKSSLAIFELNALNFDNSLMSISIGSQYLSCKKTEKALQVDADYLNESEIFKVVNQNAYSFNNSILAGYPRSESFLTDGFFNLTLTLAHGQNQKCIYLNTKTPNKQLYLKERDNDHQHADGDDTCEIFKFYKDQNGLYEIKSKSNELFLFVTEQGELVAQKYESNERNKFYMEQQDQTTFLIKSLSNQKYITCNPQQNVLTTNGSQTDRSKFVIKKAPSIIVTLIVYF